MKLELYFSRRHRHWSWVRLVFSTSIEAGHHWMYNGLVRRDTLSFHGVGLALLRLIREEDVAEFGSQVRKEGR